MTRVRDGQISKPVRVLPKVLRQSHNDVGAPVTFNGVKGAYGNLLVIDHGYGLVTRFGHLSQVLVQPGARVKRGDPIARVGNTGRSTGDHLHYEVRIEGEPNFIFALH